MQNPLIPMAIPALVAHLLKVEFMYCDNNFHEMCGQMGHLTGLSGVENKQYI